MRFLDRREAAVKLAAQMTEWAHKKDVVVVGLARGGVVIAHDLAKILGLPFDVIVVRKVGAPHHEELALGAVAATGEVTFNTAILASLGVSEAYVKSAVERERKIAEERLHTYRKVGISVKGKHVILVDDGIATGASIRVAIKAVKKGGAQRVIVAIPVAAADSLEELSKEVDAVICLYAPYDFEAVGEFYDHFDQVSDEEVKALLMQD